MVQNVHTNDHVKNLLSNILQNARNLCNLHGNVTDNLKTSFWTMMNYIYMLCPAHSEKKEQPEEVMTKDDIIRKKKNWTEIQLYNITV